MAIDTELLQILVCPEDRTPLAEADPALLGKLNDAINKGVLQSRDGKLVDEALGSALVRQDGQYAYPVREEIPIMLIGEAIPLAQIQSAG